MKKNSDNRWGGIFDSHCRTDTNWDTAGCSLSIRRQHTEDSYNWDRKLCTNKLSHYKIHDQASASG